MTRSTISDGGTSTVQTRPWLLPDLLDRQLHELKRVEAEVATGIFYQGSLLRAAERQAEMYQREIEVITDPARPKTWCTYMRLLLYVEGAELAALKRRARSAGAPPPQFELLVSTQIMEALMRGHVLAASSYDDCDDDQDGDELVLV